MEENQSEYTKTLIARGAPANQSSKCKIKYTNSTFQTNSFDAELRDSNVSFQTLKMKDSLFLWIGKASQPEFTDLSIGMMSKIDQNGTVAKILGPSLDTASVNLANRLSKKLGKQVYVSCNVPLDMVSLPYIEKCLMEEFKNNQDIL